MYMLFYFLMIRRPPRSTRTDTLFPYTTLFRSGVGRPLALVSAVRDILPVQPAFALTPWPLVTSAAYGLLIAFIFIMPPLAHARTLPAAALFRETVDRRRGIDRVSMIAVARSEERRVGKECVRRCRSRGSPDLYNK